LALGRSLLNKKLEELYWQSQLLSPDKNMDRTNDKGTEHSACSKERKGTPFQRIVIACPDNHIIVVKRFISGGKKLV